MGTEFEINDNRGVIVGIAKVPASGLFGMPTLYTTFNRAIQYIPSMRYTISYVLVEPQSPAAVPHIKEEVARLGYDALTEDEFIDRITHWYMYHTGMGTNLLLMTAISFIVGLSISGQTFYTSRSRTSRSSARSRPSARRAGARPDAALPGVPHGTRGLRPGHRPLRLAHRPRPAHVSRTTHRSSRSTTSSSRSGWS